MTSRRRFLAVSAAGSACAVAGLAPRALAQLVGKATRMVVGFPPGGSADVVARLIVDQTKGYATTIIVDNKPGAGGRIALENVKNAEPDGAAMILTPASMLVIYPHVYRKLAYDPFRDFAPVTTVCSSAFLLSVGPAVPATVKTLADFLQWCKANPKEASYGSSGAGSMPHFTGVMLARAAGVPLMHVAYKGAAPAMQDLLGGQIAANISVLSNALPHAQSGKLRALATSGPKRSAFLPNVPTLKESGFTELEAVEWFGVLVPAKTPSETISKLNAAIRDALKTKLVQEGLARLAFEPGGESPAEFARIVKADYDKWGPIVKASGFTAEE